MALPDLTREGVMKALAEFDELGRDEFLYQYGYRPARKFFIEHEGRRYDSKAIAGVAHKYGLPDAGPLLASEFSGGEETVVSKLRELGFTVMEAIEGKPETSVSRNPTWTRDELILALDLYMRNPRSPPGKTSKEVAQLSEALNLLGRRFNRLADGRYRNPNGVYMKMMNFRRFDPTATATGQVGLTRGGKNEEVVWNEFANDVDQLRKVAAAIVTALQDDDEWSNGDVLFDEEFTEAPEGRVLTRVHVTRERNRKLVQTKKADELARTGRLQCEVCGFDFEERYGERGRGFIEVHHTKPVHTLEEGSKTKLSDLALVCANCHRMIHASKPWLELRELKELIRLE